MWLNLSIYLQTRYLRSQFARSVYLWEPLYQNYFVCKHYTTLTIITLRSFNIHKVYGYQFYGHFACKLTTQI